MNAEAAGKLLHMIDAVDPWSRKLDTEDREARVAGAALAWSRVDPRWAAGWVRAELEAGNVPAVPDVATAWRTEAARRVAVPVPDAPPEVEANPNRWLAWDRARRAALLAGQPALAATQQADRLVGCAPRLQIAAGATGDQAERLASAIDDYLVRRAARDDWDEEARR